MKSEVINNSYTIRPEPCKTCGTIGLNQIAAYTRCSDLLGETIYFCNENCMGVHFGTKKPFFVRIKEWFRRMFKWQ